MIEKAWPETVCSTDQWRDEITKPFRVDDYSVCTNGHALIGVEGGEDCEPAVRDSIADVSREILTADLVDPLVFDIDALREWCGPAEEMCPACKGKPPAKDCDNCFGGGVVACECFDCGDEHQATCAECDGTGKYDYCDRCEGEGWIDHHTIDRRASVFGIPFNPRVMALMIEGAPGETVRIGRPEKDHKPFVIVGDGWRGGLMPLRWDGDKEYEPLDSLALEVAS